MNFVFLHGLGRRMSTDLFGVERVATSSAYPGPDSRSVICAASLKLSLPTLSRHGPWTSTIPMHCPLTSPRQGRDRTQCRFQP